MRYFLIPVFALSLFATASVGQTNTDEGTSLMEEGARLFFRGLKSEMEPAIDELQGLAEDIGPRMQLLTDDMRPVLTDLFNKIDDLSNYHAPEVLPNGDIIIRRRQEDDETTPDSTPELAPEIEL